MAQLDRREIRFRIWDADGRHWSTLMDPFTGQEFETMELSDIPYTDLPTNFVACQFTGLKDKNGKDIYEGDIVKARNWTPSGQKPAYSNVLVEWLTIPGSDDMGTTGFRDHSSDEVVGNIYEHPELLKP